MFQHLLHLYLVVKAKTVTVEGVTETVVYLFAVLLVRWVVEFVV